MYRVRREDFASALGPDVQYVGMWFEFTDEAPSAALPPRLPVALKPNESLYEAFPQRDDDGNLVPVFDYPFPKQFTNPAFFHRTY